MLTLNLKKTEQEKATPAELEYRELPFDRLFRKFLAVLFKSAAIIAVIVLIFHLYMDYRLASSYCFTPITYKAVENELNELTDYYVGLSKNYAAELKKNPEFKFFYEEHNNKLAVCVESSGAKGDYNLNYNLIEKMDIPEQIKIDTDKITNTLRERNEPKIKRFPRNSIYFFACIVADNKVVLQFEKWDRYSESSYNDIVYSLDGHNPDDKKMLSSYFNYHRFAKNWYNYRKNANFVDKFVELRLKYFPVK